MKIQKSFKLGLVTMLSVFGLKISNANAVPDTKDPVVVKEVDLQRYQGLWYEIAHAPNFFQKKCVRSTAEYKVIDDKSVSVFNTCYKADGSTTDIDGVAKIVDINEPAKLKVRFDFIRKGDYWITDLDPNYQWAVVSAPGKKSLFILARSAPMDESLLKQIVENLEAKGFKVDDLVFDQY